MASACSCGESGSSSRRYSAGTPQPAPIIRRKRFNEEAFDEKGAYKYGNAAETLFAAIAAYLTPDDAEDEE